MTTLTELRTLALAATPGAGWTCWRCEQRNAGWTTTCGRCELDRITPERILAMIAVIEAAKAMRELGVEISRRCIEPPYMSEKAAVNEFIGVFDGPLQRKLDAALAKLEQK